MDKKSTFDKNLKNETLGGVAFSQLVVIYVLVSTFGGLLLKAFNASEVVTLAVSSLFSVISMFIVIDVFNIRRHEKLELTVYACKCDKAYFIPAIFLAFGMLFGFGFINEAVARLIIKLGGNAKATSVPLDNFGLLVLFTVLLAVIPAIEEECFFRGLLLGNLTKGKKTSGILIVALCFALYHGSAVQFVYQFIYGGLLAFLTIRAKSVRPGIIAHFINNTFILSSQYFGWEINSFSIWVILAGLSLLAVFFAFMFTYKRQVPDEFDVEPSHKLEKVKNFFIPFGVFGVIITLTLIVAGLLV